MPIQEVFPMVFGFGEGKIELILDKSVAQYGDTINGRLILDLKKPKAARQLRVRISAEKVQGGGTRIGPGSVSHSSGQKSTLYQNDTILDGEKEYAQGKKEYTFQIQVPNQDVMPMQAKMPGGALGQAIGAASMLTGMGARINWFVTASLDMPGMDISKKVQLSVS